MAVSFTASARIDDSKTVLSFCSRQNHEQNVTSGSKKLNSLIAFSIFIFPEQASSNVGVRGGAQGVQAPGMPGFSCGVWCMLFGMLDSTEI